MLTNNSQRCLPKKDAAFFMRLLFLKIYFFI